VEKTVAENREKLSSQDVARIEAAIAGARQAAQTDDLDAMKKASEELQRASHTIAEQLYKQSQGAPNAAGSQGSPQSSNQNVKDAEVVDAEYVETN
jgi:molecular chaperone DnaK